MMKKQKGGAPAPGAPPPRSAPDQARSAVTISYLRMPYNGSDYTIRDDRDRYHVLTKRRILVLKLTLLVVET